MFRNPKYLVILLVLLLCSSVTAFAQEPAAAAPAAAAPAPTIDTGDTAWMLTSSALVLFMTIPGMFLFYGGLVRSKNVLGMLMQDFLMVGLITIHWIVIGYSLALAPGPAFLGGLDWLGSSGVGRRS